jgi:succinyl-CoA synthetase beta subunit
MDLFEHQGKELFAAHDIAVPRGVIATTSREARDAAAGFGGSAVVKAQVQAGGRGKGGAVVVVASPDDAAAHAERLLRDGFGGLAVTRVLVEEVLPIARELYASIVLDRAARDYLALMTADGGVEIEELARVRPEALRRVHVNPMLGLRDYHIRWLVGVLPLEARGLAADVVRKLWDVVGSLDASLVEVNPLVLLDDGRVVALDAKVTVDDNALPRHPDVVGLQAAFSIDPVEARAREAGLQYVKLDGEVGVIGNGAGLVMSTLDVVQLAGARAANFLDVGGGASADLMSTSLELILSDPSVRVVLINIFGGITRCDVVAAGILEALQRVPPGVPIVVRLDGTNAEEGRMILAEAGIDRIVPAATMLEAAERAADLSKARA